MKHHSTVWFWGLWISLAWVPVANPVMCPWLAIIPVFFWRGGGGRKSQTHLIHPWSIISYHLQKNLKNKHHQVILCNPFWDGENLTLPKVVGDLQPGDTKIILNHPGPCVVAIWRFPKMVAPPNHPFWYILIGFSIINHPFWGTPIVGNPHIFHVFLEKNSQFPEISHAIPSGGLFFSAT